MKQKVCYIGRKGFWTVPVEDHNGGTSVNNRIPKVNFRRREVKDRGDAKGD